MKILTLNYILIEDLNPMFYVELFQGLRKMYLDMGCELKINRVPAKDNRLSAKLYFKICFKDCDIMMLDMNRSSLGLTHLREHRMCFVPTLHTLDDGKKNIWNDALEAWRDPHPNFTKKDRRFMNIIPFIVLIDYFGITSFRIVLMRNLINEEILILEYIKKENIYKLFVDKRYKEMEKVIKKDCKEFQLYVENSVK